MEFQLVGFSSEHCMKLLSINIIININYEQSQIKFPLNKLIHTFTYSPNVIMQFLHCTPTQMSEKNWNRMENMKIALKLFVGVTFFRWLNEWIRHFLSSSYCL